MLLRMMDLMLLPMLEKKIYFRYWRRSSRVLMGCVALWLNAFEYFRTKGGGTIININSMAGLVGSNHEPLYAASKFGLRGFSESVKGEWIKHGVRMIDVHSGAIGTGMSAKRADLKSLIDPKELAEFIVGLCQTDSFFVREFNVQRTRK